MTVKLKAAMDEVIQNYPVTSSRARAKPGAMQFQTQRRPPKPQIQSQGVLNLLCVLTIIITSHNFLWHQSNWKDPKQILFLPGTDDLSKTLDISETVENWPEYTTLPDKQNSLLALFARRHSASHFQYSVQDQLDERIQWSETDKPKRNNIVQKTKVKNKVKVSLLRRHFSDYEKIRKSNFKRPIV